MLYSKDKLSENQIKQMMKMVTMVLLKIGHF